MGALLAAGLRVREWWPTHRFERAAAAPERAQAVMLQPPPARKLSDRSMATGTRKTAVAKTTAGRTRAKAVDRLWNIALAVRVGMVDPPPFHGGGSVRPGYCPTLAFHSATQAFWLSSATAEGMSLRLFAMSSP